MLGSLLAAISTAAVVTLAAATIGDTSAAPEATPEAVLAPAAPSGWEVGTPSGTVLAEMNRRLGTPRRVARTSRRHAADYMRRRARAEAIRAARRAAAAQRAAARRVALGIPAAGVTLGNGPWWDPAAASVPGTNPASPDEAQWLSSGRGGWVEANGYARAPANAPPEIQRVIQAGNLIARSPYLWGGGHGAWRDRGYDCSGSVSYALAAGGMLGWSQTSGQLMSWGADGPGRWLTIYANGGHVFMIVAGLRFDTSGRAGDHASRWQLAPRSVDGFAVRHYPGL
jgi:cell wall-associated NlpC family hydrolase